MGGFWTEMLAHLRGRVGSRRRFSSARYWQERYAGGGTSGPGSYGRLAEFKAQVINSFVADNAIESVVEFGCGDGNQLSLYEMPRYVGIDVSPRIITECQRRFADDPKKTFHLDGPGQPEIDPPRFRADLALSIDVLFHLTEDDVFERYMRNLFRAGTKFVIIYSPNTDRNGWFQAKHVKYRKFTKYVEATAPDWTLREVIVNEYPLEKHEKMEFRADFYIYQKDVAADARAHRSRSEAGVRHL